MITAVAWRKMHDAFLWWLSTVIAALDMETGRIEMPIGRCQTQTPIRCRGQQRGKRRDPHVVQGVTGSSSHLAVKMRRLNPRPNETLERVIVEKARSQGEWLMHKTSTM
jgi:hypothetical protein